MEVAGADTAVDGMTAVSPVYENQVQYRWIDLATSTGKRNSQLRQKDTARSGYRAQLNLHVFWIFVNTTFSYLVSPSLFGR